MLICCFNMFFDKYVHADIFHKTTKQYVHDFIILSARRNLELILNVLKMHKKYNTNMLKNGKIVAVCLQLQTLPYTYCSHNIIM